MFAVMRLELSTCVLRSLEPADKLSLVKHANNPAVWANLLDTFPHPYTARDAETWLESVGRQPEPTDFAIAVDDELVGVISFQVLGENQGNLAEIGYWLGQEYWGRGIATESVSAITNHIFSQHTEVRRIYARVFQWNRASVRVLEKCGYEMERWLRHSVTKAGKPVDEMLYVRRRDR